MYLNHYPFMYGDGSEDVRVLVIVEKLTLLSGLFIYCDWWCICTVLFLRVCGLG
jgi:hypothetical protein